MNGKLYFLSPMLDNITTPIYYKNTGEIKLRLNLWNLSSKTCMNGKKYIAYAL